MPFHPDTGFATPRVGGARIQPCRCARGASGGGLWSPERGGLGGLSGRLGGRVARGPPKGRSWGQAARGRAGGLRACPRGKRGAETKDRP